jgi:hypothetical protein
MRASGWRHERFALLHDVGDRDPGLFVAGLAAGMGRFGRNLETIARFQCAARLTLYGEFETAFQNIARFDSRMRMPGTTVPASISTSMFSVT